MLILMPYLLLAAAFSVIACVAMQFSGLLLPIMLIVLFIAFYAGIYILIVLVLSIVALFISKSKPQERPAAFFSPLVGYAMGVIIALCGVRVHVEGMEKMPEGNFLLVSNHRSNYDPMITGWVFRKYRPAFISKPENLKLPVVGQFCHKCGYLSLDRDNDRAALRTILEAARRIKNGGISYAIYPEGTRNHTDEPLLPFRNGAFKIAQKAGCPIVVITLENTREISRRAPFRTTHVRLRVRGVISTDEVAAMKTAELGEHVRAMMLSEA